MMKRVLLIDEHPREVKSAMDWLKKHKGEDSFVYKKTSKSAWDYIQENPTAICCVSVDLLMPQRISEYKSLVNKHSLEGLYLLELIRRHHPSLPVVCYSYVHEKASMEAISELNAEYIYKGAPIKDSFVRLIRFFDQHLGSRHV
jgi:DNA-binding NarL/FixJ family response regulator